MSFAEHYDAFLTLHVRSRSGERLRRLQEGHGHAERLFLEQVWWPAIGHFEQLHPEYEVHDFKDGGRFLDFAYIRLPFQVCFEIDGFGPHHRDISRWQFADNLFRQNHLVIDGWKIIRFSYDDIREKPRRCQQMLQQLMGRWFGHQDVHVTLTLKEKEIVRFALLLSRPITPLEVSSRLGVSDRHARMLLHTLVKQNIMLIAAGQERVRAYRLNPESKQLFL